ncbi:MAG: phosphoribosylamine--glycine ligase [Acidaminococcales bacterium]|jgi:phosphoribosylamine--glycine ligase|nr:phosphoribosylamine--glycine ligase [Acidaminococcales bacterium]
MDILVLGSGGREHALVWKLAQSPSVGRLYALPGNPGMENVARLVDIDLADTEKIADFAGRIHASLTVVGPEAPLAAGIGDLFRKKGLKIFGPSQKAAELESSKSFAKNLMQKYGIPTAAYRTFDDLGAAREYVRGQGAPIVVKADGLAAGKGVAVAMTETEALDALGRIMGGAEFGAAGARVVIEEYLEGEEISILAFTDGETLVPMPPAQDHKRALDGDLGPNTGGMGAYAPAPAADAAVRQEALEKVLKPVALAMKKEGRPYQGCLYAGLIIARDGLKVIEFNARFGDPETQALLPLLDGDLAEILLSCAEGRLHEARMAWKKEAAVCVALASGGYPGRYAQGFPIKGLDAAGALSGVTVFHAGTKKRGGEIVTAGGRVLGVAAVGADIKNARDMAYRAAALIDFGDMRYRRDIACRALK